MMGAQGLTCSSQCSESAPLPVPGIASGTPRRCRIARQTRCHLRTHKPRTGHLHRRVTGWLVGLASTFPSPLLANDAGPRSLGGCQHQVPTPWHSQPSPVKTCAPGLTAAFHGPTTALSCPNRRAAISSRRSTAATPPPPQSATRKRPPGWGARWRMGPQPDRSALVRRR